MGSAPGWAQSAPSQFPDFTTLVDAIYAKQVKEINYEMLHQRLWEFYQQPLEVNQASQEELALLCILTDTQLDQLFHYLEESGSLLSIYELQAIPEFDLATIYQLIPFVKVEEVYADFRNLPLWKRGLWHRNSYWLMRYERTLETKKGYQQNEGSSTVPYVGSPNQFLTQFRIQHPSGLEVGFSAKKGAGEAFTWDPSTKRYGFNLGRFYCLLKNRKMLKALVVGDYEVGYGQGLIVNTGFSTNKSSETVKVIRTNNLGIRPHTSLASAAFRGIASTLQWRQLELTTYYSNIDLDGRRAIDASIGSEYIQHVQRGGYYRTQNEVAKKGQVNEQVIGGTAVYKFRERDAELGINVLYNIYALPLYPNTQKGTPLRFCGRENANGGFFYRYLWQNLHFFGEGAFSKSGGRAAIVGIIASLSHHLDATVLLRHYDQDFHSLYGNAFSENASSNSDERGIYLGARIKPVPYLYFDAYYDYFHFPWFLGKGAAGHSWLTKATYEPQKSTLLYFQCKETKKEGHIPKARKPAATSAVGKKRGYKVRWQQMASKVVSLTSGVQWNSYQQLKRTTWGYALAQGVTYKISKLKLSGRVAWFNTEDAMNKMAFYEPDVLHGGFNFSSYQGIGMRYCLLVCYKPVPYCRLELRYTLNWYRDKDKVGSGQEAIEGNTKNHVKLQAIVSF